MVAAAQTLSRLAGRRDRRRRRRAVGGNQLLHAPEGRLRDQHGDDHALTGADRHPGSPAVTVKGTLTGCTGEPFTEAKYTATLTTTSKMACSALSGPGAATFGSVIYVWLPKTTATYGTLSLPLTQTAGVALSGELESGPYRR